MFWKQAHYNQDSGLFKYPKLIVPLTGSPAYMSIPHGSLYNLDYTQPFSIAVKFHLASIISRVTFFDKRAGGTTGVFFALGSDGRVTFGFRIAGANRGLLVGSAYSTATDPTSIFIGTFSGNSHPNGLKVHIYRHDLVKSTPGAGATISSGGSAIGANATLTGTATNSNPVWIGRNGENTSSYTACSLSHLSVWNKELSEIESNDLAIKMRDDKVNFHIAYDDNCIGYWREYAVDKGVDQNGIQNISLNGFTL